MWLHCAVALLRSPEVGRVLHKDLPVAGHLAAPADDDGVELSVHVLPGSQGLQLPSLLTTGPGSHDPCSRLPGSPVHSRREVRGPSLHDLLETISPCCVSHWLRVLSRRCSQVALTAAKTAAHSWHDWDGWEREKAPGGSLFCCVSISLSISLSITRALSSQLSYITSCMFCAIWEKVTQYS